MIQTGSIEKRSVSFRVLSDDQIEILRYIALLDSCMDHEMMTNLIRKPKIQVIKDLIYLADKKYLLKVDFNVGNIASTFLSIPLTICIASLVSDMTAPFSAIFASNISCGFAPLALSAENVLL